MKAFFSFLLGILCLKNFAQVNLQTGSATFGLPMFNWQDDKSRLNSIVALNYNSGNGLKVNDVASNVGQGWNLLAGGVITRLQAGEPDDQKPYFSGANEQVEDVSKYPAGYLYDPVSAGLGVPAALTRYPIFNDKNHIYKQNNAVAADKELDHFAFQFNGRSGIFILIKSPGDLNNHVGTGVFLGDSKMKVSFVTDDNIYYGGKKVRTTITSFTIQDENGLIYKFTQHEFTQILKSSYCDANLNVRTQPKFKNNNVYHEAAMSDPSVLNPYVINGWYLTEIEDVLTHRKIDFSYINRNLNNSGEITISNYYSNSSGFLSSEKNYSIVSHARSITVTPEISGIIYPDNHQVIFNYGKARIDLNGDFALASVDILYRNRYLSKYQLTSSYFILNRYGTPTSDFQKSCARLCLRSLYKIGVDLKADDPPYLFDYNLGSSTGDDVVPPPFSYHKDIWGYYNGDNSQNYDREVIANNESIWDLNNKDLKGLCYTRYQGNNNDIYNAKLGYAKNGLLKQITYPTGGSLNYNYEQNTALLNSQNTNAYGVHVSKTSLTDGGYDNSCNNPVVTNYTYDLDGSSQSSLWGVESPVNSMTFSNYYLPEAKYFYYKPIFDLGCNYSYEYPGIISREQAVNLTSFQQVLTALSKIMSIVGDISQIIDIINLISNITGPGAVIIDAIGDILNIGISCIGDHHKDNTTTIFYNSDLNTNPLPVQFKRVTETAGSGSNGKTVYDFTSSDDYAVWEPTNSLFSAKQRFAYWAYGLPRKTTIYDALGYPKKQVENKYDFTISKWRLGYMGHITYSDIYTSCKGLVNRSSSQRNTDWSDPSSYNNLSSYISDMVTNPDLKAELYFSYSGRTELDTTFERTFKPGSFNQYIETKTLYTYNPYNYQVNNISTTQSNGDVNFKLIKYSIDEDNTGILAQNNILNIPVDIYTGVNKNGNSGYHYLSKRYTEFVELANGDVKPSRILETRVSQPTAQIWNITPKEIQTFIYDAAGNLIGLKDEGGHAITNIYDYYDKYVSASIVNADPNLDKAAYTSFETDNLGGWVLSGARLINSSVAVTGSNSFSLATSGLLANQLSASLNTAKAYKVSLWSNSLIAVSNGSLVKSAPTINGLTYYEYDIPQGISNVTISGNANIDELRLYPRTARMRTVTYDPLIGKTSECDENNRITYFEYDNNSRLRFIKDENKNVIKMYEYNLAKKPTGCPVTYTNLAVSEIFTKNDCPAGSIGSKETYFIAASKYSSQISQDIVDQQVDNELITQGQAYANAHGTCIQLYYNDLLSQDFTKEGCGIGYIGTTITYTVPANKYTSTINKDDATQQAQDEIDANGQAYANLAGNASCVLSSVAVWIGTGLENCQNGNKYKQVIDQNPHSSTYNQTQWVNAGADPSCSGSCTGEGYALINGYCEQGIKVYMGSVQHGNYWYCLYHYEFSDGSWSQNYEEQSGSIYDHYECLDSY